MRLWMRPIGQRVKPLGLGAASWPRGDMREKRRRLIADWAAYCESPPGGGQDQGLPRLPDSAGSYRRAFTLAGANRLEASVQGPWTSWGLYTQQRSQGADCRQRICTYASRRPGRVRA